MGRRLFTILVVAILSAVMAAPASAAGPRDHPFGGDQVMVLNESPDGSFGLYGCEDMSWFGTIEIYGHTLGMGLYSIDSYMGDDGLLHYQEGWKIFTGTFNFREGMLKRCEPGGLLVSGVDSGTWSLATGEFESFGTVDYVSSRFRDWAGRTVHQEGVTELISGLGLEDVFGFFGSLELR
jgi:hypothetical protein